MSKTEIKYFKSSYQPNEISLRVKSNNKLKWDADIVKVGNLWHTTMYNNIWDLPELKQEIKNIKREDHYDLPVYVYTIVKILDKLEDRDDQIEKKITITIKKEYDNYMILQKLGLKKYTAMKELMNAINA